MQSHYAFCARSHLLYAIIVPHFCNFRNSFQKFSTLFAQFQQIEQTKSIVFKRFYHMSNILLRKLHFVARDFAKTFRNPIDFCMRMQYN